MATIPEIPESGGDGVTRVSFARQYFDGEGLFNEETALQIADELLSRGRKMKLEKKGGIEGLELVRLVNVSVGYAEPREGEAGKSLDQLIDLYLSKHS